MKPASKGTRPEKQALPSHRPPRGEGPKDPEASDYPEPGTRAAKKAADTSRAPRLWWTATELARATGVCRQTVSYWARKGKVEKVSSGRTGRYLRFTAEAVSRACVSGAIPALTKGWI